MPAQRLSPWYPASVLPKLPGTYEVRSTRARDFRYSGFLSGKPYRYFDGRAWFTDPPGDAWHGPSIFGKHDHHEWRGLAEAPHG